MVFLGLPQGECEPWGEAEEERASCLWGGKKAMISKPIKLFIFFTLGPLLILMCWAVFIYQPSEEASIKPQAVIIEMPVYSVLDEEIHDSPVKTQVVLELLVSGKITEDGLRNLLNKLYSSTKAKRGFKYHSSPTNIYIYAYTSKEHCLAGMGQWIAMLDKSYGDSFPKIHIKKEIIAGIGASPEEKFGLTEEKRKQIWNELIQAEDRSTEEAEERYPLPDAFQPNYSQSLWEKQNDRQFSLQETLYEKYQNELKKKYELTDEQLDAISVEGLQKNWPFPPSSE